MSNKEQNLLVPQGRVPVYAGPLTRSFGLFESIFAIQMGLNRQLVGLQPEQRGEVVNQLALCVIRELDEVLRTMPETRLWRKDGSERGDTAGELMDVMFFLVDLVIATGIDNWELREAYLRTVEKLGVRYGIDITEEDIDYE